MTKTSKLILALILCWPFAASAATIAPIGENIAVDDEQHLFRYRSDPGLWQRSVLESEQVVESAAVSGRLFLTVRSEGIYLLLGSKDGLTTVEYWRSTAPINLLGDGTTLFAATQDELFRIEEGEQTSLFSLPTHAHSQPLDYLAGFSQAILFAALQGSNINIFDLTVSVTTPVFSRSCSELTFIKKPAVIVGCDGEATLFTPTAEPLFTDAPYLASSDFLSVWGPDGSDRFWLFDGQAATALVFPDWAVGDSLLVAADRLFWRKASGSYEVAWRSDPVAIDQLPEDGTPHATASNTVILLEGTSRYYSFGYGSWQLTDLPAGLELIEVSDGLIAYKPLGSLAYYESSPGQFLAMERSWAASSKIKAVERASNGLLLVLRNSSNNPNIYRSTDFRSWQRLTMPSQPTHLVDIEQARLLPSGTQLEIKGKISVLPGFVSDEIAYLWDNLNGIQVFLSRSKGNFPVANYREAVAIGEKSSSRTGRILLEDAGHLLTGAQYSPSSKQITVNDAKGKLANTGLLNGVLDPVSADSAVLSDKTGSIKLHFDGIKEEFQKGDQILVEAVVDYNASSQEIEAWRTGKVSVIKKAPTASAPVLSPPALVKSVNRTVGTSSQPITPVSQGAVNSLPVPTQEVLPTTVASSNSKPLPDWLLMFGGLVAGALIFRGRRLQQFWDTE